MPYDTEAQITLYDTEALAPAPAISPSPRIPQVGDIVHYIYRGTLHTEGDGCYAKVEGEHRPAIVVRKWGNQVENRIQLQVFTDGTNDFPMGQHGATGLFHASSVAYSAEHEHGTWHWPEHHHQ